MKPRGRWLEVKRAECWALGVEHRESLLRQYMVENSLRERPFLKDVINDLIEEMQGACLREQVLPLDTFAQTEVVNGRIEVSINSRIAQIPGVKDAAGVGHVAKWHESLHVAQDMDLGASNAFKSQGPLPGFDVDVPRLIICRRVPPSEPQAAEREFVAENAALAAAIAGADLARCSPFLQFQRLAAAGGDLGSLGWRLLYETAERVGVNITALVRYFEQRGLVEVIPVSGRRRLIAAPQLLEFSEWL